MSIRRGRYTRPPRLSPGFLHVPDKQRTREMVAQIFFEHFGDQSVSVYVMPFYDALCAKAINDLMPNANFHGTDRKFRIAEQVEELPGGKVISMRSLSVRQYIQQVTLKFDAAWLDYFAHADDRADEVINFADKMMKPRSVLAVTVQEGATIKIAEIYRSRLLTVARSVTLLKSEPYVTNHRMVLLVFLLEKGEKS